MGWPLPIPFPCLLCSCSSSQSVVVLFFSLALFYPVSVISSESLPPLFLLIGSDNNRADFDLQLLVLFWRSRLLLVASPVTESLSVFPMCFLSVCIKPSFLCVLCGWFSFLIASLNCYPGRLLLIAFSVLLCCCGSLRRRSGHGDNETGK